MKTLASAAAVTLLAFATTGAQAQSAKFSASWTEDAVTLFPVIEVANYSGPERIGMASEHVATVKSPQGKELLIGVSGIVTLNTFTQATGKGGGSKNGQLVQSTAEATLQVEVKYAAAGGANPCFSDSGYTAAPGAVTFASRTQTLGVAVSVSQDGTEVTDDSLNVDVTVALGIDTTAAHHFNFVAYDMDSGEWDIYACYTATEEAVGEDALTSQSAAVAVGKRVIAVQEVRAVKTGETIETSGGKI